MKTFVVCVDASASVEERDNFTKHLRASPEAFWHHIDHTWIVCTKDEHRTAKAIHYGLREFISNSASIVMEVLVEDYNAFCSQYAHTWLNDHVASSSARLARLLAESAVAAAQSAER